MCGGRWAVAVFNSVARQGDDIESRLLVWDMERVAARAEATYGTSKKGLALLPKGKVFFYIFIYYLFIFLF